ncbi:MAG: M23 family metallopeptidase [Christensenellaceae bacterium]|jgi:hypothetical protein|nr:M23 family metallopeptidase [Christensenellaceae bacterium]
MENNNSKKGMFKLFLKKNLYYIVMFVCVLGIGSLIIATVIANKIPDPDDIIVDDSPIEIQPTIDDPTVMPDEPLTPSEDVVVPPIEAEPIIFTIPTEDCTIVRNYSMAAPIKWETLGHFAVHNGIDFAGPQGAPVRVVFDGTVVQLSYDILNGHKVVVDHGDGLLTTYGSLSEPVVTIGQVLSSGEVIGELSNSASSELELGAHLHFSVIHNSEYVDPLLYLPIGDK